jgi:hypothetical protein
LSIEFVIEFYKNKNGFWALIKKDEYEEIALPALKKGLNNAQETSCVDIKSAERVLI